MHYLLDRQVKKIFGEIFQFSPELEALLKVVSTTYDNHDKDRELLDRSFEISSKEFLELHNEVLKLLEELKIEKQGVEQKVIERTKELKQKVEELNQSNQLLARRDEELTLANKHLLELDKVKSEFVSLVSHQLRTPLTIMSWYTESLENLFEKKPVSNVKAKKYVKNIAEANHRMRKLVNATLEISRIESGRMNLNLVEVDIPLIVEEITKELVPQIKRKKIVLKKNYDSNLPKPVLDERLIFITIENILSNAVKYTDVGGTVSVHVSKEEEGIGVNITDSGMGISITDQEKIFEKLFRTESAVKKDPDGSGLGLYIAKTMVGILGGSIKLSSTEGKGSTFSIKFPLKHVKKI